MKLQELLTEAKAKFRDTKGARDQAIHWLVDQYPHMKANIEKDAVFINGLVATLAKVVGKKMKAGKYGLNQSDRNKLSSIDFTYENLSKVNYKKITGKSGGGKPHSKLKATPKKTVTPKKNIVRDKWDIHPGDWIDSKNGTEFSARVTDVKGGKVYVTYDIEGWGDETHSSADIGRFISGNSEEGFYAPSWTF